MLFQLLYEEVLSHSPLLDTITAKSASIAENYVAQLELQDLQERYNTIKDNSMVINALIFIAFTVEYFFFAQYYNNVFFH